MPWTTWTLAALLVGIHLLELAADILNLKTLRRPLPDRFSDLYDAQQYAKMQALTVSNTKLGVIESTAQLAGLLVFWLAGGIGWLDASLGSLGFGQVITGLLFAGSLWAASFLVGLPFAIYDTFVIEERFGFNRTTPATFAADQAKSIALTVVLGGLLGTIVFALFLRGGEWAWLYGWLAASVLMIGLIYLAPPLLLPLFNKFSPLGDGPLRNAILEYAEANRFPLHEISVMDGSRRSARANAFFTGFGAGKRVVLYDTLVERHTVPELVAVLAHEVGHFKCRHIVQRLAVGVLTAGLFFWSASLAVGDPLLYATFGVGRVSIPTGIILFAMAIRPLNWALSLAGAWVSRRHEFTADAFAARTTGDPAPLVGALKKLTRDNLSNLTPHPLFAALHHSHPPLPSRVAALEAQQSGSPGN